jgi:hypothetical protein
LSRRILTQREQWPFRCGADEAAQGDPTKAAPAAAMPKSPIGTSVPKLPNTSGLPKAPSVPRGPTMPSEKQIPQKSWMDPSLPSVEAAGITDVDYSHLPGGEPLTKGVDTSGGSGGGIGGAGGGGNNGMPSSLGGGAETNSPAPASGDVNSWKQRIRTDITPQLQQRGITDPAAVDKAVNSIYQQGITESGWRDIPQAITDVNSEKGTPAQSYLQYVPSTFEHAMDLAGTPGANIHDPDAQIRGVIPLEESEGKFGPSGFSDNSGSGVGYGHGWG